MKMLKSIICSLAAYFIAAGCFAQCSPPNYPGDGVCAAATTSTFSSGAAGLAPASGGGTTNFLRADGSWVAPSGSGTVTSITAGTGLTGGTITTTGTVALDLSHQNTWTTLQGISAVSAFAFFVGNGVHNAFVVDTSVASAATSITVTSRAAGNAVGIATNSTATDENITIDAKGAGQVRLANVSTGGVYIGTVTTATGNYLCFNGSNVITQEASSCPPSDAAVKHDVQTIADADLLQKVLGHRGVRFTYNEGKGSPGRHIGVIANEWEADFPELVTHDDDGTRHFDYASGFGLLLEVIKRQEAEITAIRKKLSGRQHSKKVGRGK